MDLDELGRVRARDGQLVMFLTGWCGLRIGDELVEFAREHKIAFVPFAPLGSAHRDGPARLAGEAAIVDVARRHGATPTQIALAWLLARYDRMLLIPGTGSVAHLEENMVAGDVELDDSDLAELDNATQLGDPMAAARD